MQVIGFPTSVRVLRRLGLDHSDEVAHLDYELREIDRAIAALRGRRKLLLMAYRRAFDKNAITTALSVILLTAVAANQAFFKPPMNVSSNSIALSRSVGANDASRPQNAQTPYSSRGSLNRSATLSNRNADATLRTVFSVGH